MRASIVIQTLNEAEHLDDLIAMISGQKTDRIDIEAVLIDSGSADGAVKIAQPDGARITTISKSGFAFGRSLNRGCAFATGDILVLISGHCVPVDDRWLQYLCKPLVRVEVSNAHGRQIGDDDGGFPEPERTACSNAVEALDVPVFTCAMNKHDVHMLGAAVVPRPANSPLHAIERRIFGSHTVWKAIDAVIRASHAVISRLAVFHLQPVSGEAP